MMMMTVMLVGMAHDTMGAQKKNEDHELLKNTIPKNRKICSLLANCVFLSSIFFSSCSSVKENNISENSIQNEKYEKIRRRKN